MHEGRPQQRKQQQQNSTGAIAVSLCRPPVGLPRHAGCEELVLRKSTVTFKHGPDTTWPVPKKPMYKIVKCTQSA